MSEMRMGWGITPKTIGQKLTANADMPTLMARLYSEDQLIFTLMGFEETITESEVIDFLRDVQDQIDRIILQLSERSENKVPLFPKQPS